jgi:hypothetical protein
VGLEDVTRRRHRVGLVVGSRKADPSAFAAHPHSLVFAEAGDIARQHRPFRALDRARLAASIHFGMIRVSSEMSGNSPSTFAV